METQTVAITIDGEDRIVYLHPIYKEYGVDAERRLYSFRCKVVKQNKWSLHSKNRSAIWCSVIMYNDEKRGIYRHRFVDECFGRANPVEFYNRNVGQKIQYVATNEMVENKKILKEDYNRLYNS